MEMAPPVSCTMENCAPVPGLPFILDSYWAYIVLVRTARTDGQTDTV